MTTADMRFADRVVVITGAGGGIGRAIATAFGREGARVVVTDVDRPAADRTVAAIAELGASHSARAMRMDVADAHSVRQTVDAVLRDLGGIDVLVNNAGIATRATAVTLPEADWDRVLDTNLKGTLLCCQAVAASMIERGGGSIVNITSVAGVVPVYEAAHYGASKAAIRHLTMSLAVGLAEHGIRVNAVQPGTVLSPMNADALADPAVMAERIRLIPLGRVGDPADVAAAVLFLASDAAGYITGVSLPVDGGNVLMR
jgi:NAD(P)-dependent dehydrogenase (short-subunit alcohol dehydrogenase family)